MIENTAIVIPVYKQFSELNWYEKISFAQTVEIFKGYKFAFVTHESIRVEDYVAGLSIQFDTYYFDPFYFGSIAGYNKLLMAREFYESFSNFKFILICQLDVFVFSNKLPYFESLDYDYIGAPWFEHFGATTADNKILGVGNGGFSLRKISAVLKVLDFFDAINPVKPSLPLLKVLSKSPVSLLKVLKHEMLRKKKNYPTVLPWQQLDNEDIYWSIYISGFFPWYKVASVEHAIAFAFETRPELLYAMNNNNLPMGVHAWQKYNLAFWQPYIEALGYKI
jgi:hypothetical protein